MSFEININEAVAKADKLDIEYLRRYYAARNIEITIGATGKSRVSKPCLDCRQVKPMGDYYQHVRKDGTPGQRDRRCNPCRDAFIAAKETAKQQRRQEVAAERAAIKQTIADAKARAAGATPPPAPKVEQQLRDCETCGDARPFPAEYIDRFGRYRKSCTACRGLCFKPPYGNTTCPGCGQEKHRQEFRMRLNGQIAQGRPFQTCLACRNAKG